MKDIYTVILAACLFWIFMTIAAYFDLKLKQYNTVNTFVHAFLLSKIYMWILLDYQKLRKILRLNKIIYRLQESSVLWQCLFTETLIDIKFKSISHEFCCLIYEEILIFFYMNNIVLTYQKSQQSKAKNLIDCLKIQYNISEKEDFQWFLEITIYRNCKSRLAWLNQASYIEKIAKLADSENDNQSDTSMTKTELLSYELWASH